MIEVGAQVLIIGLMITGFYYVSKSSQTSDTEIHNGMIQAKHRVQGSYIESYQCHCRTHTTTSGSGKNRISSTYTTCLTCYRDHYTVDWFLDSTIGKIDIQNLELS